MEELVKNNKKFQILTEAGWSDFAGVLDKGDQLTALVKTQSYTISCTLDHKFFLPDNKLIAANRLKPKTRIKTLCGVEQVVSVKLTNVKQVYDVFDVEKGNRFYANGILVKNCSFIIADETLIAPAKLIDLEGKEPAFKTGEVRWYKKPVPGKIYIVALDPSLGTGGDPAAIQVFEANSTEQVAEWRHNKTDIVRQIRIFADIIKYIHDITNDRNSIYYSVENNTIGEAALLSIAEYGEDNIPGYFISEPRSKSATRRFRKGFNTANKSKLSACAKFKQLVESRRMQLHSKSLISELKNFVASGTSYAAKPGETDDLVMATLLAVRMMQVVKNYHKDLDEHMSDYTDESREPLPFILIR